MSDPMSGEVTSVAQPPAQGTQDAVPPGASGERSRIDPQAGRARRRVLAVVGLAVVVAVVVLIATDPFGGGGKSTGGVADNASATSLTTVKRQSLSQQTQVSGTLGYAGSSSIRVPSGTAPSAVQQASQQVTSAETMLARASSTLASDTQALAGHQATLAAARAKEGVDCAGEAAAEAASANSSPGSENGSSGAGGSSCSSDAQAVSSAQQNTTGAAARITADRSQVSSAEKQLASAQSNLSTARSSAALYGQSSTFTALASVGQIIRRGQSLYEIGGQPVLLLYGSTQPTRAFLAGMSAGRDVAELNANLDALGYGQGLTGEEFTAATAAAIRALQSAHGASVTGELLLGSVVFESGPVRVTSATPTVGSTVMPGPVLDTTSTARQVKLALDASEQDSVKVGDTVTITLPDNQTTPGRITYVSSVATSPSSGGKGGGGEEESAPTVEVDATPTDPAATGHLDQAPVNVEITTESVENVLAVPVEALLALAGGGYAVEVAEGRVHRLVAVTVGLFDDAEGLVQVSGQGLSPGQRVVVPASP
jgi:multidrug efflux pump subunit AcrA (membrane-fusion protein)